MFSALCPWLMVWLAVVAVTIAAHFYLPCVWCFMGFWPQNFEICSAFDPQRPDIFMNLTDSLTQIMSAMCNKLKILDNWNKFESFLYILSFFEVTVQVFDYKLLLTIVFFGKRKKNVRKTHFKKEPHFENQSSFQNSFWKCKVPTNNHKLIFLLTIMFVISG